MRLFPLLLVCCSINTFGRETWLCSSQASQIQGSSILACGVGEGSSESIARRNALLSAKEEFSGLCDANSECSLHRHSAVPGRTTCESNVGHWKCYRLVTYTVVTTPNGIVKTIRPAADLRVTKYDHLSDGQLLEIAYRQSIINTLR